MNRRPSSGPSGLACLIFLAAGCAGGSGAPDARIAVSVAPLDLSGISDATYRVTVTNGAASPEVVWSTTLSSSRYGDGRGSVLYVGTCDASPGAELNRVDLELLGLRDATRDLVDGVDFENPAPAGDPVSIEITCVPDTDTRVDFDLVVLRRAGQGFFDVAVEFDDIFCSAKADCAAADGQPQRLLFDPATGLRVPTLVVALTCTTGTDEPTELWLSPPVLTCDGVDTPLPIDRPDAGNVFAENPAGPIAQLAAYRGAGEVDGQATVYANWALALDPLPAGVTCSLSASATADAGGMSGGTTPDGASYPYIVIALPDLADETGLTCGLNPLDDPEAPEGVGVYTRYTDRDVPRSFSFGVAIGRGGLELEGTSTPACGDDACEIHGDCGADCGGPTDPPGPVCGDGTCDADEVCPGDCGGRTLSVVGPGHGAVTSAALSCDSDLETCSAEAGGEATFTAAASAGSFFMGWSDDGCGVDLSCTTSGDLVARFGQGPLRLDDDLAPQYSRATVGDTLFFVATRADSGNEIFQTDGTPEGTRMAFDLFPGSTSSCTVCDWEFGDCYGVAASDEADCQGQGGDWYVSANSRNPNNLTALDGALLFTASGPDNLQSLHRYDPARPFSGLPLNDCDAASPSNPCVLAHGAPGIGYSFQQPYLVDGRIFFFGNAPGTGTELFATDGTVAGTGLVADIFPGVSETAGSCSMWSEWCDTGTRDGCESCGGSWTQDANAGGIGNLTPAPTLHAVYFSGNDSADWRYQLWRFDTTRAATASYGDCGAPGDPNPCRVDDADVGAASPYREAAGRLWYVGDCGGDLKGLCAIDANGATTRVLPTQYASQGNSVSVAELGGRIFIGSTLNVLGAEPWGHELMRWDPGAATTAMGLCDTGANPCVIDVRAGAAIADPQGLHVFGDRLYFNAKRHDYASSYELFATDGTLAGTFQVREFVAGDLYGGTPSPPYDLGDYLVYTAQEANGGFTTAAYVVDRAGHLVRAGGGFYASISPLGVVGGSALFAASNGTGNRVYLVTP